MALSTNVARRKGSRQYYARLGVPKDLQKKLRKRELWKSLGTTDPQEAKRRVRPVLDQWEREFAEVRKPRALTETELQDAVWKRYLEMLTEDERFRRSLPSEDQLNEIWRHLETEFGEHDLTAYRILETIRDQFQTVQAQRTARFAKLKRDTAKGESALVADVVQDIINARRLDLGKDSDGYRKLAQGIQRAELEALGRSSERDDGDWSGQPRDKLVSAPAVAMHGPGEKISELYDRFKRERPAATSDDTWNQNRKIVILFDEFVGGDAHVSALTRKNVRDWKAALFRWPVKAADSRAFKGMSFTKIIEANEHVGKPPISPTTINRYLSALGGFCSWLRTNDFTAEDVMQGMFLDLDRSKRGGGPFTSGQLSQIFASPLFLSCMGDKREHEAGPVRVRDWRYWVPLIALYSGARLGEIAQLLVADVRELHRTWIFHITTEGKGNKKTKTKGSQRVVPIHSELIKFGFLDYYRDMVASGHEKLFPEIEPDGRGYMSGNPSSFFNDYFSDVGAKKDKSVNFHSFRHSAIDAFRRGGYLDEQFACLIGHVKATTTGRYGILPEGPLSQRIAMIEAVAYDGLDLSHLCSFADVK
jgi:integrase